MTVPLEEGGRPRRYNLLSLVVDEAPAWQALGACNGCDADLFFPDRGNSNALHEAKEVCAGCDVREPCLEYALLTNTDKGIWGGKSERERRQIKKDRKAAAS